MKYSLFSLIFLKTSLVFLILLFSFISLHWSLKKAFLSLLVTLWNSAFKWVYLSFSPLPFTSLLWSTICKLIKKPFASLHFFFLGMVLNTAFCTVSQTSIHSSSALCLSDLIPWVYVSFLLYNCKGFDLGHAEWSSGFLYFLQFKSEFGNKETMVWATVSSWSCFCWLYRASPSLTTKNIVNLISVLTSGDALWSLLLCCGKRVFAMTSVSSWQNSVSICPDSFCTTRPNLPVIPATLWLPTFAFQSPIMKRTSFLGVTSTRFCSSS